MTIIYDKLRLDIVLKLIRPVFTNSSVEFSIKPSGSPQFIDQSA